MEASEFNFLWRFYFTEELKELRDYHAAKAYKEVNNDNN